MNSPRIERAAALAPTGSSARASLLGSVAGVALALSLLAPVPAAAQNIVANVLSFEGRTSVDLADLGSQTATPISGGECTGMAAIAFRFTMVDPARANLSFFYGTGCDDPAIRTDTTNSSCIDLNLQFAIQSRSQVDATISADQLIDCASTTSGTRTIWVLAIDEPTSTVTAPGQRLSFPLAFDFTGPAAPSGLTASGGEAAVRLTWTPSTDQVSEYEVFLVPGGCSGGTPTVTIDPSTDTPIATIEGTNSSATVAFPSSAPIGGESAVAIRAIDRAGNTSELSAVQCVSRFEVTSWFDMYCGGGSASADACGGAECSVRPGRSGSAWALGPLVIAGLLLAGRRGRVWR